MTRYDISRTVRLHLIPLTLQTRSNNLPKLYWIKYLLRATWNHSMVTYHIMYRCEIATEEPRMDPGSTLSFAFFVSVCRLSILAAKPNNDNTEAIMDWRICRIVRVELEETLDIPLHGNLTIPDSASSCVNGTRLYATAWTLVIGGLYTEQHRMSPPGGQYTDVERCHNTERRPYLESTSQNNTERSDIIKNIKTTNKDKLTVKQRQTTFSKLENISGVTRCPESVNIFCQVKRTPVHAKKPYYRI